VAKAVITWSGSKTSAANAQKELTREIERMAKKGYRLETSAIVQAGWSKKSWILLSLLNFIRAKQVQATATFRLIDPGA